MTPNASKQGKFGTLGAIFLFILLPCMWGLGSLKESPISSDGVGVFHVKEWGPKNSACPSKPRKTKGARKV